MPTDDHLLDWANTVHKPLAGHVTFFEDDRETVSFAVGQCVSYQESFVAGEAVLRVLGRRLAPVG